MLNPWSHLKAAATGDLTAQRTLAEMACKLVGEPDLDPVPVLTEGLIFARLAAAQSGDVGDNGRVLAMLAIASEIAGERGDTDMQETLLAEGMARVSLLADRGDEVSAMALNGMAEEVTTEGMAAVKVFEKLLAEGGIL